MAISPARPEEFVQSSSGCFAISNGSQGKTALTSQKAFQLLSVWFGSNIIVKERNSNNIVFQLLKSVPSFNHIDSSLQSSVLVLFFSVFSATYIGALIQFPFYTQKMQRVSKNLACLLPSSSCIQGTHWESMTAPFHSAQMQSQKCPLSSH